MEESFNQEAVKWIDQVNMSDGTSAGWRLEVLSKRFHKKFKDVDGIKVPLRIRRFVRGLPWALVHDAIRYLMSLAPYTGVIYNGVKIPGTYRPTITRWVRDDQERVDGQAGGSYTLVQDLIEDDSNDGLSIPSGGSCSEEIITEWRWDDPTVPEVQTYPDFGQQGISYSIQAVRRNDDGTFEYAVVKKVALTQFSGWRETSCTSYEETETATWDNVYGGLGGEDFRVSNGEPIPDPHNQPKGILVVLNVTENPDCTFRVVAQRRTDKRNVTHTKTARRTPRGVVTVSQTRGTTNDNTLVDHIGDEVTVEKSDSGLWTRTVTQVTATEVGTVSEGCQKDVFTHRHETVVNTHDRPKDPEASEAGGGKTFEKSSRITNEGTWDVSTKTTSEIEQPRARVIKRKTLRGVITTTSDRNMDARDVTVMNVGDEATSELTPGGLWDNTKTTFEHDIPEGAQTSDCSQTIFEHQHAETVIASTAAAKDAPVAGGGATHRRTTRHNDDGTWDITDQTTHELPVEDSTVTVRKGLRSTVTITEHSNVSNKPADPLKPGEETVSRKTPGGRFNTTKVVVKANEAGTIKISKEVNAFETVTSTTVSSSEKQMQTPVSGGGKHGAVQSHQLDDGTWDNSEQVTTECECQYEHSKKKSIRGTVETVNVRSGSNKDVEVKDPGESKSAQMTPGGLYNRMVVSQIPESFRTWDVESSLNHLYTARVWFINATEREYKDLVKRKSNEWKQKLDEWVKKQRPYSGTSIDPSVHLTEWDRYDGEITFTVRWATNSAGMEDDLDKVFFESHSHASSYKGLKTFKNWLVMGRGRRALERYANTAPDVPSLGCDDSFSFSPETDTWTFRRKQEVLNRTK